MQDVVPSGSPGMVRIPDLAFLLLSNLILAQMPRSEGCETVCDLRKSRNRGHQILTGGYKSCG